MIATTEDEIAARASVVLASFEDTSLELALGVCGCVLTELLSVVPCPEMRAVLAKSWFIAMLNDAFAADRGTRH